MKAFLILLRFPFWLASRIIIRPKYQMSLVPKRYMSQEQRRKWEQRRNRRDRAHRRQNGLCD